MYPTSAGLFCKDDIMKRIPLTQGKFALVDDEDFGWLNQHKWCVLKCDSGLWYATRGKGIFMHRAILGLKVGDGIKTDHRNHNGLDNRQENLRKCTNSENQHNQKPRLAHLDCTSKYKGVSWLKNDQKWRVLMKCSGKWHYLGLFTSEINAAKAYDKKAKELFGEFAQTNF